MDNIISLGRTIYEVDCNYNGTDRKAIAYATYPNRHNKSTVSIIDLATRQIVDTKTFYVAVAKECIEEWVMIHFNPACSPKLTLIAPEESVE